MKQISCEFQIFVKPVGAACNMHCSYCYYLGKKDLYPGAGAVRMNDEILEKYIIGHIEAATDDIIMFSWHGGEPLLAGIDFFRKAVQLQHKYKPPGRTIINGIQTNGTLLDEEWCRFLAAEGFIAGVSIDGPGDLHNKYRRTHKKSPSLHHVLRGFELLQKHGVKTEILCVLNSSNVKFPLVIYNFFKQLGTRYITFLPLVVQQHGSGTGVSAESVAANEFGFFLKEVFDEWVEKDIGKIKIQIFEEAARTAFNQEHTLCIFKVNCGGVPVVEHNGDFYSCDHYVDNEHLIGNIKNNSLAGLLDSPEQKAFGRAKSVTLPRYCTECTVKEMCNGECPKNRFIKAPDGEPGLNYLCRGYKLFFTHCRPFVEAIRVAWKDQNSVN
jgi:uncharacterized protein